MGILSKIRFSLLVALALSGSLQADAQVRAMRLHLPSGNSISPGLDQMRGEQIEFYAARLSARDHYNSSGQRLLSPAAIIRQDRANFYVFGLRDPEDEPDSFFSNKGNRARLEQMLENGRTTREAYDRIVNGTPLIRVDVDSSGITVTILSD
jgi:hypothetical protein